MQPDSLQAFHQALRLGPGYCPADLFDGTVPSIVRGLKAHATNIAYARHTAIEETYPRLARRMGASAFHDAVERFLELQHVLGRSLDLLGDGFVEVLTHPHERDLALVEWAWSQAFQAQDAEALTLSALAQATPDHLLIGHFALHPATRCVRMEAAHDFVWDNLLPGSDDFVFITRPGADVRVRRADGRQAAIVAQLDSDSGESLSIASDPTAFIALVEAGAIVLENQS